MLVPAHFIENIFRSGLTIVISNDIITVKIDNMECYLPQEIKQTKKIFFKMGRQMYLKETKSDHEMEKYNLIIFTF